ncbi:uncharacterized protein LOC141536135 isoform X1 [Cotesia typhae]|uniref:uncharacterized protein LOC141536135 isoform X1 n=1 Tax=Cotesia typhae TaxID=2053667 RepID=UPI003D68F00D
MTRKFECEKCHNKFRRRDTLKTHLISCNKLENQFHCPKCDAMFRCKYYTKRHIASCKGYWTFIPAGPPVPEYPSVIPARVALIPTRQSRRSKAKMNFRCDKCGKYFRSRYHLNRHYSLCGNTLKAFGCSKCGRKFRREDYVKNHMTICNGGV